MYINTLRRFILRINFMIFFGWKSELTPCPLLEILKISDPPP